MLFLKKEAFYQMLMHARTDTEQLTFSLKHRNINVSLIQQSTLRVFHKIELHLNGYSSRGHDNKCGNNFPKHTTYTSSCSLKFHFRKTLDCQPQVYKLKQAQPYTLYKNKPADDCLLLIALSKLNFNFLFILQLNGMTVDRDMKKLVRSN